MVAVMTMSAADEVDALHRTIYRFLVSCPAPEVAARLQDLLWRVLALAVSGLGHPDRSIDILWAEYHQDSVRVPREIITLLETTNGAISSITRQAMSAATRPILHPLPLNYGAHIYNLATRVVSLTSGLMVPPCNVQLDDVLFAALQSFNGPCPDLRKPFHA